jgi:hypothetical protein
MLQQAHALPIIHLSFEATSTFEVETSGAIAVDVVEAEHGVRTVATEVVKSIETTGIGETIDRLCNSVTTEGAESDGIAVRVFEGVVGLHRLRVEAGHLTTDRETVVMHLLLWILIVHDEDLATGRCQEDRRPRIPYHTVVMAEDEDEGVAEEERFSKTTEPLAAVDHLSQAGIVVLSHQLHPPLKFPPLGLHLRM